MYVLYIAVGLLLGMVAAMVLELRTVIAIDRKIERTLIKLERIELRIEEEVIKALQKKGKKKKRKRR